jgi:hypothetical protein
MISCARSRASTNGTEAEMETLHKMMRQIRGETKSRPDHLAVFREFLGHLDRIGKRAAKRPRAAPRTKAKVRRKG